MDAGSKVVTVYIRRGEAKERLLSFRPPAEIPQTEMLERGYAFDGQSVVKTLPQTAPGEATLAARLLEEQKALVDWLGQHGYSVEFK